METIAYPCEKLIQAWARAVRGAFEAVAPQLTNAQKGTYAHVYAVQEQLVTAAALQFPVDGCLRIAHAAVLATTATPKCYTVDYLVSNEPAAWSLDTLLIRLQQTCTLEELLSHWRSDRYKCMIVRKEINRRARLQARHADFAAYRAASTRLLQQVQQASPLLCVGRLALDVRSLIGSFLFAHSMWHLEHTSGLVHPEDGSVSVSFLHPDDLTYSSGTVQAPLHFSGGLDELIQWLSDAYTSSLPLAALIELATTHCNTKRNPGESPVPALRAQVPLQARRGTLRSSK